MLYDDFQNENSHYNCKDSVFRQNDIIIFRQNDIKTRKDRKNKMPKGRQNNRRTKTEHTEDRVTERQGRQNDRMYIINTLLLSYYLFLCYSVFFTSNQFTCQPVLLLLYLLYSFPLSSLSLANCASYLVSFDAGFIFDAWRLSLGSSVVSISTEIYSSLLPIFL